MFPFDTYSIVKPAYSWPFTSEKKFFIFFSQILTCLNIIQEFSPYLKENLTFHHYKDQLINAVYRENHTIQINTNWMVTDIETPGT